MGGGNEKLFFNEHRVSVFQDRKVLDMNGSDNCVTKKLILTLVKTVRKTSFRIIVIGVQDHCNRGQDHRNRGERSDSTLSTVKIAGDL